MDVSKYFENEKRTNALIFALGVILVLVGIVFEPSLEERWSTVIISVGASIIASSVVAYITSVYMFKRKKQKEVTEIWGLKSITGSRAEMNIEIDKRLEKMNKSLDVAAYGLKSFRESVGNVIEAKIKKGVNVRILTVDPFLEILSYRDSVENKLEGSTSNDIKQLVAWFEGIKSGGTNANVEIRYCDFLLTELYFRVDDRIYVGPYEIGKESQRTITMEFANDSKGFAYYSDYFNSLWNAAKKTSIEKSEEV